MIRVSGVIFVRKRSLYVHLDVPDIRSYFVQVGIPTGRPSEVVIYVYELIRYFRELTAIEVPSNDYQRINRSLFNVLNGVGNQFRRSRVIGRSCSRRNIGTNNQHLSFNIG